MHLLVAIFTEPQELVRLVGFPFTLDHKAPRPRATARRVSQPGGAEKNLSFPNFHHLSTTALRFEMQLDFAVNLLKEFFAGFAMKIEPRVRTVQDHHKKIFVVRDYPAGLVRRIEKLPVFLDPGFDIDRRQRRRQNRAGHSQRTETATGQRVPWSSLVMGAMPL